MVTNSYNFWNDLLSGMHKVTIDFNYSTRQGTATLDSIQHIGTHLTEDQKRSSTTKWKGEKLWIRPNHLQMLCKPFSQMSSGDWDSGPCNTNRVEWANSLAKNCERTI